LVLSGAGCCQRRGEEAANSLVVRRRRGGGTVAIWIRCNASRVWDALEAFGAPLSEDLADIALLEAEEQSEN
jgi:hypothetical protein